MDDVRDVPDADAAADASIGEPASEAASASVPAPGASASAGSALPHAVGSAQQKAAASMRPSRQPVRAINEDDDGYDPYSDWHDQGPSTPLFERDPWD